MNSSAFTFFEAGLEDINEHLTVAEYVNAHTTAVVSRAYENFLRDAVIKTVGNIDAYFSKIIFELLLDRQAIFSTNLSNKGDIRINFSLKELSDVLIEMNEDPLHNNLTLRRIIDEKLRTIALQNHNVPNNLSRLFGVDDFWTFCQADPLTKQIVGNRDIHEQYKTLTERRNTISHNHDRDIINTTTQNTISREFVDRGIITTRIIVNTFERQVVDLYS
jgi:hypothetical protein